MDWHLFDTDTALREQGTDPAMGLSSAEAAGRLSVFGPNELQEGEGVSPWLLLREQFTSTMALILIVSATLSAFVGSFKDSIAILAIVCLFALLGFVQEYRAERAIRALKRLAQPSVRVRRNGEVVEIPAADLAPGDILLLEAGNLAPADCRVIESHNLKVQESVLTGEADTVEKNSEPLLEKNLPLGDRRNMLYRGTTISHGRCLALVVATGMATELGRIAAMLQDVGREWTPLQRRLDRLGKVLAAAAALVSLVFFVIGIARGEELRLMLLTTVSLAVAVIPEGLPAVVTITLAIGAQRMLGRHVLIRRLPAVETLGSVTVICSDKTGTLTENQMTVTDVVAFGGFSEQQLLAAGVLCNDAVMRMEEEKHDVIGDPTEGALLVAAAEAGLFKEHLEELFPRVFEIPFDSASRRMVTFHSVSGFAGNHFSVPFAELHQGEVFAVAKGGADVLLPFCADNLYAAVMARVETLASQGKRVLACAVCRIKSDHKPGFDSIPQELSFVGLIAMMDPPRREARRSVERCMEAGIRPVMITGDYSLTAAAIAKSLGIPVGMGVVSGSKLDGMGPDEFDDIVGLASVYARVAPELKLRIVDALKKRGEVVAMTGDGVNDAPALKKADIGISMGISGTDVAKESSDMVLMDDNFATIVAAVEEGRTIYDNIRKFVVFSVSGNLGKILAVMVLPFMGLPMPLTPLQLLWLNLLTDGLLGLGMGMEGAEPDVMRHPPISTSAQIFNGHTMLHTLLTGLTIGLSTIVLTGHFWRQNPVGVWQTVLFTSLAFAQVGQVMSQRSFGQPFFRITFFSNPVLLAMVASVLLLQCSVLYLPIAQKIFGIVPLKPFEMLWALLPGIIVFTLLELKKAFINNNLVS